MKIKAILAAALAAVAILSSCSKDEGADNKIQGETKSFYLQIGQEGVSRATGADQSSATVTLTDGVLFFATGDNITRVITIAAATDIDNDEVSVADIQAGIEIGEIPASTTDCYFYGNLGSTMSSLATQTSVAAVEALTWALADIQNATNDVAKVPLYGTGTVVPGLTVTDRLESKFNVGPVASRLQIGSISVTDNELQELKLAGIFINGFYKSMTADLTATNLFDNGIDAGKYNATGYTGYTSMMDVIASVDLVAASGKSHNPGSSIYWAYNFFPARMPHIVLHWATVKVGDVTSTDKYSTVAKYSTDGGGAANFFTAAAGKVYTLNIVISDHATQIDDLPEESSFVMGFIDIDLINWTGATIYPEW